jgi:site-specific recombinase XerD
MFEELFVSHERISELQDSPDAQLLDGFAQELCRAGYARITARRHLRAAEHLAHWTRRKGKSITTVEERVAQDFARHLDHCKCPGYGCCARPDLQSGVRVFLNYIRHTDVLRYRINPQIVQEPDLWTSFCQWMRQQRGTGDKTLYNYRLILCDLIKSLGEDPAQFDAQSLRKFVFEKSKQYGRGTAKRCTTAVRMFLRFLIAHGKCSPGLDACIPTLAHWRLSSLPPYLQPDEVEMVIASCDPTTPMGKRDRAILLLLARMGLRAGDIVQLRLGDIDWKKALIQVSGKGRRQTCLPLTKEIGDAVANYLKDGRPQTDTDRLFLRSLAPFRALTTHCAVSEIVNRAMRRAGVTCPSRGAAHLLRHSVASSMLRQGASLQDIAVILRHRSIKTTEIYAKVDISSLQQIAQPWPEVELC